MKINENQWFWCFSRSYGTRWYQTESRKRENIKKYFQTFSDTSETYVSEGKKSSRQSGVDYLRRQSCLADFMKSPKTLNINESQ